MDAAIHIGIVRSAGTSTTPQVKQIWKFASVAILVESVWLLAFGIAIHVGTPANAIHADRNAMSAWVGQVAIAGIVEAAGLHFLLIVIAMIQTLPPLQNMRESQGRLVLRWFVVLLSMLARMVFAC